MSKYEIAVIPGDGIGREVMPEALRVLEAIGASHGLAFAFRQFDWSCETYRQSGALMPPDGIEQLRGHDAILLGAVGCPGAHQVEAIAQDDGQDRAAQPQDGPRGPEGPRGRMTRYLTL